MIHHHRPKFSEAKGDGVGTGSGIWCHRGDGRWCGRYHSINHGTVDVGDGYYYGSGYHERNGDGFGAGVKEAQDLDKLDRSEDFQTLAVLVLNKRMSEAVC